MELCWVQAHLLLLLWQKGNSAMGMVAREPWKIVSVLACLVDTWNVSGSALAVTSVTSRELVPAASSASLVARSLCCRPQKLRKDDLQTFSA